MGSWMGCGADEKLQMSWKEGPTLVGGVVEGKLRKLVRSSGPEEKAVFERKLRVLRAVLFIGTVLFFPVIGYLLGLTVSGRG